MLSAGPADGEPVPTLYIWGDQDLAQGRTAAEVTARYVEAPYRFEVLEGYSHWLLDEASDKVSSLMLDHLNGTRRQPGRSC